MLVVEYLNLPRLATADTSRGSCRDNNECHNTKIRSLAIAVCRFMPSTFFFADNVYKSETSDSGEVGSGWRGHEGSGGGGGAAEEERGEEAGAAGGGEPGGGVGVRKSSIKINTFCT